MIPSRFELCQILLGLFALTASGYSEDLAALCADRAAIERVYYNHRLGTKPPFDEVLPLASVENLVRLDMSKEAVLKRAYGIEVTSSMLELEAQRINTTTRAPEMIAEIKSALHDDPDKFRKLYAKPILIERILRERFDNDDNLHAAVRQQVEQARAEILKAREAGADFAQLLIVMQHTRSNAVRELTWRLDARPANSNATTASQTEVKQQFGPTAKVILSPNLEDLKDQLYFEDLSRDLQNILRAQLRKTNDVSAVIETPAGFLLYLAKLRTDTALSVAALSLPKRSYDQWLSQQGTNKSEN